MRLEVEEEAMGEEGCNVRFMNNVTFRFGWFAGHIYGNTTYSWWNNDKIMHVFFSPVSRLFPVPSCHRQSSPADSYNTSTKLSAANAHLDMGKNRERGGPQELGLSRPKNSKDEVLFYYWCPLEPFSSLYSSSQSWPETIDSLTLLLLLHINIYLYTTTTAPPNRKE